VRLLLPPICALPSLKVCAVALLILSAVISLKAVHGQSSNGSLPQPSCGAAENRQFDFWVGYWDVYPKKTPEKMVAHSLIEKLYYGCVIRENWMPLIAGGDGGSLNAYRPVDGLWHQVWSDSSGAWVEFTGRRNGAAMVLEGVWPQPGHPKQRTRMTYSPLADGAVEQLGESSDDEGKSWQPSFDFVYRPATDKVQQK